MNCGLKERANKYVEGMGELAGDTARVGVLPR